MLVSDEVPFQVWFVITHYVMYMATRYSKLMCPTWLINFNFQAYASAAELQNLMTRWIDESMDLIWIYVDLAIRGFTWIWIYVDLRWFTLIYIVLRGFTLIFIDFHWFSLIYIDSHGFILIFLDLHSFSLIYIDFHGFKWIYMDLAWFLLI